MKASLILVVTTLLLSACHPSQPVEVSSASISPIIPPLHMAGQSYTFGPQMDTTNCKVIAACDCCETQVLFPNDHEFVAIFLCLQDNTYAHGTYRIEGDKVYLSFEGKKVDDITDFVMHGDTLAKHGDTTLTTERYETADMPHSIDTLTAFMCRGVVGFKSPNIDYGTPDSAGVEETAYSYLRKDSILLRMGMK